MLEQGLTATALGAAAISLFNPTAQHHNNDVGRALPPVQVASQWSAVRGAITWGSLASRYAWGRLRSDLQRWQTLPDDWDGDGGIAPSSATLADGRAFLDALEAGNAPPPSLGVAGDGEIEFKWTKEDGFASVSFLSDGHLVAYVRPPQGSGSIEIDEPASETLWRGLLKSIAAFA